MWGNCVASAIIEHLSVNDLSDSKRENMNGNAHDSVQAEDNAGMELSEMNGATYIGEDGRV